MVSVCMRMVETYVITSRGYNKGNLILNSRDDQILRLEWLLSDLKDNVAAAVGKDQCQPMNRFAYQGSSWSEV